MTRFSYFYKSKSEQNHEAPGFYMSNNYANDIMSIIKSKTQSRQKTQETQKNEILVFQKNSYKMQTYVLYKP